MTEEISANEAKINIDGREYLLSALSDEAKSYITQLRVIDNEMATMRAKQAIYQTARDAYSNSLKNELPD